MITKVEPKITKAFEELIEEFNKKQEYEVEYMSFELKDNYYEFKKPNLPNEPTTEIVPFKDLEEYLDSVAKCDDLDCMPVSEIKDVLRPKFIKELL